MARPAPSRRAPAASGPARGARYAAAAAAIAAAPRTTVRPALPRPQLIHVARGFSVRRTVDSVLHGRGWIGLLTVLLLGVIFMQVHMLKLNAGVSRAVETASTLEKQNAQLRQAVSQLGAPDRIEDAAAAGLGMTMPQPGSVRYLRAGTSAGHARRAVEGLVAPAAPATAAAVSPGALSAPGSGGAVTEPASVAAAPAAAPTASAAPTPGSTPTATPIAPAPDAPASPAASTPAGPAASGTPVSATPAPASAPAAAAPASPATGGATAERP